MKTELNLLATGIFLAALSTGLGQSTLQFSASTYTVAESAGAVTLAVQWLNDPNTTVSVDFGTADGTATNGLKYTAVAGTLAFGAGETNSTIVVPIVNDAFVGGTKNFRVVLSNPTNAVLSTRTNATVSITDNDVGVQFQSAAYSVTENGGEVLIGIVRGDDGMLPVTVDLATTDLTATSGLDYVGNNYTLSFAPTERFRRITNPILNDSLKEASETFRVTLSNPSGGILGPRTTTTVTIQDNDPALGFELSSYSVCEKAQAGEIMLMVVRGNDGTLSPITVDYATSDVTATAGNDYQAVSNTLAFQENETVKSLTVPILRPTPTGGATLATAITTVNILENYPTLTPPSDARLAIRREGGVNVLTWTGDGQLQRADRVTGPWQTLTVARSPWPIQPTVPMTFYRVKGARPVTLYVPSSYDGQSPMPLVILLHGYTLSGQTVENWFGFRPLAEARGFLYCFPDGTVDQWGYRFWNATDACCDFGNAGVDDAGYLRGIIEETARRFAVDRKRIYLVGASNGGFLAYRMACQSADLIAGLASLNGMTFLEPTSCHPSQSVNILHLHGTDDADVFYYGGALVTSAASFQFPANLPPFPGAVKTIQTWAGYNGASDPVTDAVPSLDLTKDVAGLDTVVTRYTTFPPGGAVELWTINGAGHFPTFTTNFSPRVIDWLLAHPKP